MTDQLRKLQLIVFELISAPAESGEVCFLGKRRVIWLG